MMEADLHRLAKKGAQSKRTLRLLILVIFASTSTALADSNAECLNEPQNLFEHESIDRFRGVRILSKTTETGSGLDVRVEFRGGCQISFKNVLFGYDGMEGFASLDPEDSLQNDFSPKRLSKYLSDSADFAIRSCNYTIGTSLEGPNEDRRYTCAVKSMMRSLRRVAVIQVNLDAKAAKHEVNPVTLYLFALDGRFIGVFGPSRVSPPCTAGTLVCDPN